MDGHQSIKPCQTPRGDILIYGYGLRLDPDCLDRAGDQTLKAGRLYNTIQYALIAFLLPVLGACSAQSPQVYEIGGGAPTQASEHVAVSATLPPLDAFILQVASAGSPVPLAGGTNLERYTGYYGGAYDGCARVAVLLEPPHHTDNVLVCNGRIRATSDPIPALPGDSNFVAMRDSLSRSAWSTGRAMTGEYGGSYQIVATPLAPHNAAGCGLVASLVTAGPIIVDWRQDRVCGP